MEEMLHLSVGVSPSQTLMLLRRGPHEMMKAALPPPYDLSPHACPAFLMALASWYRRPLSVALFADGSGLSSALGLCNSYGVGERTLHYKVQVVEPGPHRGLRLHGIGNFEKLRRATRGVWL